MREALLLALAAGLPLVADVWSPLPFEPSKAGVLRIVGVLLLLLSLSRLTVALLAPTVVVESYLLSTVVSVEPLYSLWGSAGRAEGIFTLIALFGVCLAARYARPEALLTCIVATSVPLCLIAVLQWIGIDVVLLGYAKVHGAIADSARQAHPYGTLGNSEYLGSYLAILLPLTAWRWLSLRGVARSWVLTALVLQIVTLGLTGSRGAVVGVAVAAVVVLWRLDLRKAALVLATVALVAVALLYVQRGATSAESRWLVARQVPGIVALHPWLGYGPETGIEAYDQAVQVQEGNPTLDVVGSHYIDGAQNIELDALVTRGVFGLAATLLLWGVALVGAWRWRGGLGMGVFAALLAGFVDGQVSQANIATSVLLWLLFGLVLGQLSISRYGRAG